MNALIETREVDQRALSAMDRAGSLEIKSNADYLMADSMRSTLKEIENEINNTFDPLINEANKHHKSLLAEKTRHAEPIEKARRLIKTKMGEWDDAQKALRLAEEKRLQDEARKKAEDEALAAAAEAEKNGHKEEAQAILEAPVQVPAVIVPNSVPKTSTVFQTRWKYRVTNPNLVPREYLIVDETKVGNVVRATKGTIKIPGIEPYSERC